MATRAQKTIQSERARVAAYIRSEARIRKDLGKVEGIYKRATRKETKKRAQSERASIRTRLAETRSALAASRAALRLAEKAAAAAALKSEKAKARKAVKARAKRDQKKEERVRELLRRRDELAREEEDARVKFDLLRRQAQDQIDQIQVRNQERAIIEKELDIPHVPTIGADTKLDYERFGIRFRDPGRIRDDSNRRKWAPHLPPSERSPDDTTENRARVAAAASRLTRLLEVVSRVTAQELVGLGIEPDPPREFSSRFLTWTGQVKVPFPTEENMKGEEGQDILYALQEAIFQAVSTDTIPAQGRMYLTVQFAISSGDAYFQANRYMQLKDKHAQGALRTNSYRLQNYGAAFMRAREQLGQFLRAYRDTHVNNVAVTFAWRPEDSPVGS